jgi:hypothetical protein
MEPTTTGRYRVLNRQPDGTILLVDLAEATAAATGEDPEADLRPIAVTPPGVADSETEEIDLDPETAETIADLEPGYVVEATLAWADGDARFLDCSVTNRTRIQFADGVTGIFEKAQETWHDAKVAGDGMNSAVTYSTGKEPNGVVYVFAKQSPPRDLFEEFRSGATPIEPLIQQVDADHEAAADAAADTVDAGDVGDAGDDSDEEATDADETPDDDTERAVFVMNPADEEFVLIYIVFKKDGMLAQTVRDTYGLPAV